MLRHSLRYMLMISLTVESHVFMGSPAPFGWDINIDRLVMPMNGDPNHQGAGWNQQPFPCKNLHRTAPHAQPKVTWHAGENVTFQ